MTTVDDNKPCCPMCGGTTGYRYIAWIKGEQWMTWNHEGVSFADLDTRTGAKRCQDCNRIVRQDINPKEK